MRLFSGLSFPLLGRARAGISSAGTPWVGARGGAGGAYIGVRHALRPTTQAHPRESRPTLLHFDVEDDGAVFVTLAKGVRLELDTDDLRRVVNAADYARRQHALKD